MSELNILFNASKREDVLPNKGYKKMLKKLKSKQRCTLNKEEIESNKLSQATLFILGGPQELFTQNEFDILKAQLQEGHSVLLMLNDTVTKPLCDNLNYFLEDFGIGVTTTQVMRTVFYKKQNHPKECLIQNGVVNDDLYRTIRGLTKTSGHFYNMEDDHLDQKVCNLVQPQGVALTALKPAFTVINSGPISFPTNKPVCAIYMPRNKRGRLCVIGSTKIFDDEQLEKEENVKLFDTLISYLMDDSSVDISTSGQSEQVEQDITHVPDIGVLSETIKCCMQQSDNLPLDFTKLFDTELFKFDTCLVPTAVELYNKLDLKHEPLTLIPPQFEAPMPPLKPATFPPVIQELPNPSLELQDLDEYFATEQNRIAQITNKCNDDDLDQFMKEVGEILGITDQIAREKECDVTSVDSKEILFFTFKKLLKFKKRM